MGCSPDGRNINDGCGSLHTDGLRAEVAARGADLGMAFDGDADRVIFASHTGREVNGDGVLLVAARLLGVERLRGSNGEPAVVGTVMANLGLERALAAGGIRLLRTAVGDKYVLEEMRRRDLPLGGEQSGHIILLDRATTGDGLLTALHVLEAMRTTGLDLDQLTQDLNVYPQVLVNVRVARRSALEGLPAVAAEIRRAEDILGDAGRVLVRFSGTEPLARIMLEGPDQDLIEKLAGRIADAIRKELA